MRRRSVARVSSVLLLAAFALVAVRLQAQNLLRSLAVPVQFSAYWRPAGAAANGTSSSSSPSPVERIYYINLNKNTERRRQMEGWLGRQPIPYQRVEATAGADTDPCPQGASKERCRGIAGLARTNLGIIRSRNVSGLTLVFEDDYVVERDLARAVRDTLERVPGDWDIIRWDCVGPVRSSFPVLFNARDMVVFRTAHLLPCRGGANESYCTFCGSTHAMLWRDASLPKIEALWAKQPFDDIDCRLVTTAINSYCVNMGLGFNKAPESEWSDITYIRPRNATS